MQWFTSWTDYRVVCSRCRHLHRGDQSCVPSLFATDPGSMRQLDADQAEEAAIRRHRPGPSL
jgi:hypothetical protein